MQTHRRYDFKNQHFVGEEGRLIPLLQQAQAEDGYLRRERLEEIHRDLRDPAGAHLRRRHLLRAVPAEAGRQVPAARLPRHRLPRQRRGRAEPGGREAPRRPERRDDRRPAVQHRDGVLPRLLLAGAGDDDQRRDVRQPQPVGRGEGREEVPEGGAVMTRVTVGLFHVRDRGGRRGHLQALEAKLAALADAPELSRTGCVGMCYQEPLVEISDGDGERYLYGHISPDKVGAADRRARRPGDAGGRLAGLDERRPGHRRRRTSSRQHRIVLRNCGNIDPESIDEYIADGRLPGAPEGARGEGPRRPDQHDDRVGAARPRRRRVPDRA